MNDRFPKRKGCQESRLVSRAWWATVALFLLHGLVVATWVSRIPAIQSSLHLNNGVLGMTLLCAAIGSVIAIPFTGMLINRYGSKRTSIVSSAAFCLALTGPALAFNALSLGAALFILGAIAASMDVSMNAQGVEVEKELGHPTMSRFHAMFSLGAMVGAGLGGIIAARGLRPLPHFAGSSVVYVLAVVLVGPFLLTSRDAVISGEHRLPFRNIPTVLLALSAIAFCMLLSEGAMADWTAVYLKQVLNADPGTAAAGYSAFSATMAVLRLAGDWITAKLGPALAVRSGSLVGACGLLWALCSQSAAWALPGFAAVGCGFSVIIPLVFGSGGRVADISPGSGVATVTGIGYVGFIIGPPTIGFVSQLVTLRYALGVVVACCLTTALLATSLRNVGSGPRMAASPEPL
jgi:MFS family permease